MDSQTKLETSPPAQETLAATEIVQQDDKTLIPTENKAPMEEQPVAYQEDQELIDVTTIKSEDIKLEATPTEVEDTSLLDSKLTPAATITPAATAPAVAPAVAPSVTSPVSTTSTSATATTITSPPTTVIPTTTTHNVSSSNPTTAANVGTTVNTAPTTTNTSTAAITTANTTATVASSCTTNILTTETCTYIPIKKDDDTEMQDCEQTPTASSTTNFEEIQNQLKKTLDHIELRNMVSGFQTLSDATSAVVDHCEQLGLTSDDHPYNAIDREQFWAGLNNCWLYALAQRHEPSNPEERMTDQQICKLRERVVTWADKLERYGLVDYEMGWWEADILAAIDAILAVNYASAQAAAQAVVVQAAAALFGDESNKQT